MKVLNNRLKAPISNRGLRESGGFIGVFMDVNSSAFLLRYPCKKIVGGLCASGTAKVGKQFFEFSLDRTTGAHAAKAGE